jgi:hypothetical protein
MNLRLQAEAAASLPALAWVAEVCWSRSTLQVWHGAEVEVGDSFAVEGLWDGDFSAGRFHKEGFLFGSGLVADAAGVWFVPSRALVDRVICGEGEDLVVASNSLVAAMAWAGAELQVDHDYRRESYQILKGLDGYDPTFALVHPQIRHWRQHFHDPVLYSPSGFEIAPRQSPSPVESFQVYSEEMAGLLERLKRNSVSPSRRRTVPWVSTISSGYDSPAVTALAMQAGLEECLSVPNSNSLLPAWVDSSAGADGGELIAEALGCPIRIMESRTPTRWEDEVPYLSPSAADPELALYPVMEHLRDKGRVKALLTGYHGDKTWDRIVPSDYLGPDLRRGDISGLNLSEARLEAGVIHVALPFFLARSIRDLQRIAASPEMAPWALGNDYDRPIPRRILEEAGVGRELFGMRKRAVVQRYPFPKVPEGRARFFAYLEERYGQSVPLPRLLSVLDNLAFIVLRSGQFGLRPMGIRTKDPKAQPLLDGVLDLPYRLHVWALQEHVGLQRAALDRDPVVPRQRAGAT